MARKNISQACFEQCPQFIIIIQTAGPELNAFLYITLEKAWIWIKEERTEMQQRSINMNVKLPQSNTRELYNAVDHINTMKL